MTQGNLGKLLSALNGVICILCKTVVYLREYAISMETEKEPSVCYPVLVILCLLSYVYREHFLQTSVSCSVAVAPKYVCTHLFFQHVLAQFNP